MPRIDLFRSSLRTPFRWVSLLLFGCLASLSAGSQIAGEATAYTPWALVFYSFALTILASFLLINVALENRAGLFISALFAGMLISIWLLEDGLIGVLPSLPRPLNDSTVLSAGQITAAIGFLTAMNAFHEAHSAPRFKQALHWMGLLSLVTIPVFWLIQDFNLWMAAANTLIVLMIGGQVAATRTWQTHDARRRKVPMVTAALALGATLIILMIYLVSDGRAWIEGRAILRVFFLVVTIPTMIGILLELIDVRRSRDKALQDTILAARKDAETSASLLEMERQYTRAKQVAEARTRQLSTSSHDIRQPIASMRSELDALRGDVTSDVLLRLERVLDHMDDLTQDLSESSQRPVEAGLHGEIASETLPATLLFQTLERMFGAEARSAGVDLRFVPSSHCLLAPPLIVMRMTGNIIANAIKHAGASNLLIGFRRRNGQLRLDFIDDGDGFKNGETAWAFVPDAKGVGSTGTGQGLAILNDLSETYGLNIEAESIEGKGSRFSIFLMAAHTQ